MTTYRLKSMTYHAALLFGHGRTDLPMASETKQQNHPL